MFTGAAAAAPAWRRHRRRHAPRHAPGHATDLSLRLGLLALRPPPPRPRLGRGLLGWLLLGRDRRLHDRRPGGSGFFTLGRGFSAGAAAAGGGGGGGGGASALMKVTCTAGGDSSSTCQNECTVAAPSSTPCSANDAMNVARRQLSVLLRAASRFANDSNTDPPGSIGILRGDPQCRAECNAASGGYARVPPTEHAYLTRTRTRTRTRTHAHASLCPKKSAGSPPKDPAHGHHCGCRSVRLRVVTATSCRSSTSCWAVKVPLHWTASPVACLHQLAVLALEDVRAAPAGRSR